MELLYHFDRLSVNKKPPFDKLRASLHGDSAEKEKPSNQ